MPHELTQSKLPQELNNAIIDYLALDLRNIEDSETSNTARHALLACNLTSRSFSHRARCHLFRSLYLDSSMEERIEALRDLLKSEMGFASYIEDLHIDFFDGHEGTATVMSVLPEVLDLLYKVREGNTERGLRSLGISGSDRHHDWSNLGHRFVSAIENLIHGGSDLDKDRECKRPLESLWLSYFADLPIRFIEQSATSVRKLTLQEVGFEEEAAADAPLLETSNPTYALVELVLSDLGYPDWSSSRPTGLLKPTVLSRVVKVAFKAGTSDFHHFQRITAVMNVNLDSFTLDMTLKPDIGPHQDGQPFFELTRFRFLRHIKIKIWMNDYWIGFLYRLLSNADDSLHLSIEHLEVEFFHNSWSVGPAYYEILQNDINLRRLDDFLTNSRATKRLQKVDFVLQVHHYFLVRNRSQRVEEVREAFEAVFVDLNKKGLLGTTDVRLTSVGIEALTDD